MLKRAVRIFCTIRYLKAVQVIYQIRQRLKKKRALRYYEKDLPSSVTSLVLIQFPSKKYTADSQGNFTYLNLSKSFPNQVNWNFMEYGKLWNYNLQYIDFINQDNLAEGVRLNWLRNLYKALYSGELPLEPYPVSLRVMNLIRFLSRQPNKEPYNDIIIALRAELFYLSKNYEYHILGNHLLENAFAMLMGGCFFNNKLWQDKAILILKKQLNEQILKDGAHFELSPMYHQIILFRVLEAISFLSNENDFTLFLRDKASLMLGWLKQISFSKGEIPHFNDSTDGIAYTTPALLEAAALLNIQPKQVGLGDSGYRKVSTPLYECIIDANGISPDYQPGHNHADHLSFVLYVKAKPFIVDPGTSTYTISERRQWERSSQAHNTVTVHDCDQSEVWGGFRVGQRADVNILNDSILGLKASVSYNSILHTREFIFTDQTITIKDAINVQKPGCARFYLHPETIVNSIATTKMACNNGIMLNFANAEQVFVKEYFYACGFNLLKKAKVIEVYFKGTCATTIRID